MNAKRESGIRPYGPGKFSAIVDEYVYGVMLDGADEECGECEGFGWYGLLRGSLVSTDFDAQLPALTDDEEAMLANASGCILSEDSQGFVYVEYFNTPEELAEEWERISAECAAFYAEEE